MAREYSAQMSAPAVHAALLAVVLVATACLPADPRLSEARGAAGAGNAGGEGGADQGGQAAAAPIRLVTMGWDGSPADGDSFSPVLSDDGSTIAFFSEATNLLRDETKRRGGIFLLDLRTGHLRRVATSVQGGSMSLERRSLSRDGSWLVFTSDSSVLVADDDNSSPDVFVWGGSAGLQRVSVGMMGTQARRGGSGATLSADASVVAFSSASDDLIVDPSGAQSDKNEVIDVYLQYIPWIAQPSRPTWKTDADCWRSTLSADGSVLAFDSASGSLVTGDAGGYSDVFLADLDAGSLKRVGMGWGGVEPNGPAYSPSLSANGSLVAFESSATNLVPGDFNKAVDVFIAAPGNALVQRVSVSTAGEEADGASWNAVLSSTGRAVSFHSEATTLVPGDENRRQDVFVRFLERSVTRRVSVSAAGDEGDDHSFGAVLDEDAHLVAFASRATNLVQGDTNGHADIFVVELKRLPEP